MFKFFKIKTKLDIQVEEYLAWRSSRTYVSRTESITSFTKFIKHKSIEEVTLEDIHTYAQHIRSEETNYTVFLAMKDIRVMFRYFKARKYDVIDPNAIGDYDLTEEAKSDIMKSTMIAESKPKMGRPPQIGLIKAVKFNRDYKKMKFRDIASEMRRDVAQIHKWYKYDLTKLETVSEL